MQTTRKRLAGLIGVAAIFVILLITLVPRETPSESVQIGFSGPSLVETNAVLFTITNLNGFPINYRLSIQAPSRFTLQQQGAKTGDVFPGNTFTFHVVVPSTHRWQLSGRYWPAGTPKLSPARAFVVRILQTLKLQQLSEWMARPASGRVTGPEMATDRPN